MPDTLQAGSYSTGTLREDDLIEMFATIGVIIKCDTCKDEAHDAWTLSRSAHHHEEECLAANCTISDQMRDARSELVMEMFDHVGDSHTPPNHYFGAIEGDGADFGVWEVDA